MPDAPSGTTTAAGLFPRFLARLLDALIVGLPLGIVLSLVLGFAGIAGKTSGVVLMSLVSMTAMVVYHVHFESKEGRTPGKRVFGMRIVNTHGAVPTVGEALQRNAWILLGAFSGIPGVTTVSGIAQAVAGVASAVTIATDDDKQGWHDKFAGTRVLLAD